MNSKEKTILDQSEYEILNENDQGYQVQFNNFNNKSIWIAKNVMSVKSNKITIDTWILKAHIYK